jgi:hypothetical protein
MSGGGAAATCVPPTWRVAAVLFAVQALWLTWIEVEALRSPERKLLHLVPRALWIVALGVLTRGLWLGRPRARTWAIRLLILTLACYVLIAAIVRRFDAATWDPAAWFGLTAILRKAWTLVPLALLCWPSDRRRTAPT